MTRYVAHGGPKPPKRRPRAEWDEDDPVIPDLQVFEPEVAPVDTGLLDKNGVRLYRLPDKFPIGFAK